MKSSKSLDEILKDYPAYDGFIGSVDTASKWLYSILNDWKEENINIISHLADADGFGSQIVFHKGVERLLGFLGNTNKRVRSKRIMSFSEQEGSSQNLRSLCDDFSKQEEQELENKDCLRNCLKNNKYIILDLATLNPACANKNLNDALIVDHHKPKQGFDPRFNIVNPHLNGIDGGKELSASMISTFIINRVYELVESEYSHDKAFKPALKKLREDLDYISIFGIAGSKADMQEDIGLNKAMYEYLEGRGLLEKVNCPFYGYSTKESGKVFAQTSPMFNFMFRVPDKKDLNRKIARIFPNLSSDRESLVDRLYNDFSRVFVSCDTNGSCSSNLEVNVPYVDSLPVKDIIKLNVLFEELTGSRAIDVNYDNGREDVSVCEPLVRSKFEGFDDDVKDMSRRVVLSEEMIRSLKYDPEKYLSRQRDLIDKFKEMIGQSLLAFGDRDDLEWSLAKLEGQQYVSKLDKELTQTSISEIANSMTAMSKLECGELYMNAIDDVLNSTPKRAGVVSNTSAVLEKSREYREYVYRGMQSLEERMLSSNKELIKCDQRIYFMNLDFLEEAFDGNIDLKKMNGVMSGIASNVKLLPGGKGIFFTGVSFNQDYEGKSQDLLKISGRATDSPMYEGVKINRFMEHYGGGGHGPAAACIIPKDRLDDFLKSISKFDFYRGEFDE